MTVRDIPSAVLLRAGCFAMLAVGACNCAPLSSADGAGAGSATDSATMSTTTASATTPGRDPPPTSGTTDSGATTTPGGVGTTTSADTTTTQITSGTTSSASTTSGGTGTSLGSGSTTATSSTTSSTGDPWPCGEPLDHDPACLDAGCATVEWEWEFCGSWGAWGADLEGRVLARWITQMLRIEVDGSSTVLYEHDDLWEIDVVSALGDRFGHHTDGNILVFDDEGNQTGQFPVDNCSWYRLFPHAEWIFVANGYLVDLDNCDLHAMGVLDGTGAPVGLVPPDISLLSAVNRDALYYRASSIGELRRVAPDGTVEWGIAPMPANFRVATFADRVIFTEGGDVHVAHDGVVVEEVTYEGTPWNIEIDHSGAHAVISTHDPRLYHFANGTLAYEVDLMNDHDLAYAKAISVSERGETLVGGSEVADASPVLLFAPDGPLRWTGPFLDTSNAWRPAPVFLPGGDRFLVFEYGRVTSFRITR